MLGKNSFRRIMTIFMVNILLFTALPIFAFAATEPWDEFSQYLPQETPAVKRDLRATWISTVINLDWPSSETSKISNTKERVQKSMEELIAILDKSVEMNMNAVFFQVSAEGDAFYKSDMVNWSRYLTGTYGKDPGFDPLAFAIEEAHKRNLEVHAWFNPYRVSMYTNEATIDSLNIEKSVYKEHPDWIRTANNRFVVDPGIPEARQWVINRVMEVVDKYDVDGIHFDDYFYYEKEDGELQDVDTYEKYNLGQFANKGDWRRNNTYLLVKELSEKIRVSKPWVKFGISPSGVWANQKDGHPDGSNTSAGLPHYNRSYADTKKWVEEEIIDYIAPQIYFSFGNPRAPYGEISQWWTKLVKGKKVHLYVGQGLYKVNDDSDQYFKGTEAVEEMDRQLKYNISNPEVKGSIMFRCKNLFDNNKQSVVDGIKGNAWRAKALVPVMPWKGGKAPNNPTQGRMAVSSKGIQVSWVDQDPNTAYYAIYRINKNEKLDVNADDSSLKLVTTQRKEANGLQAFIDKAEVDPLKTAYVVTALDRLHNESTGLTIGITLSKYFNDIGRNYGWAVDAIDYFYENKIIFGVNTGMFGPSLNTKRGDFILMVVRALNLKADFKDNFSDVSKATYYYHAIGVARELGLAGGYGDKFNPNGNITREDMMVIMARAIDLSGMKLQSAGDETLEVYHDAHLISNYARDSVARLTKGGLIAGSGGGIKPKHKATRAEIVVVLHRLLKTVG
ncbi:family 10 glycosylhydrolase [Alkaliphilus hydrothermalis]|uniref:Uncharacterized lipoprotein YddW (UPF0748 family) n=1 Tax=Alkaliphilus hydrothermalis TaxID=1482730 RepID=A0ABS2NTH7_9FIRM|nr:family 10 glycosylhydrolase [Alkaliphilus hydrothermalis]MBM7616231.1 uncharacterized lipoprotein YddW (UPF0748 family) [Alkaliphilus hydrothermalis]